MFARNWHIDKSRVFPRRTRDVDYQPLHCAPVKFSASLSKVFNDFVPFGHQSFNDFVPFGHQVHWTFFTVLLKLSLSEASLWQMRIII